MAAGLSIFHFVLVAIAVVFLVHGTFRFVRGEHRQTFLRFIFGLGVWGSVLVLGLFPEASHVVSRRFGFGENLNTLIFTGFVVVFALLFHLLGAVERLERSITEIVRKSALEKLDKGEGEG